MVSLQLSDRKAKDLFNTSIVSGTDSNTRGVHEVLITITL